MRPLSLAFGALLALAAAQALAQPRTPPALLSARQNLQQCIVRNAGFASAHAEATRDTVADYAARQCEKAYIRTVTRRKLMDAAQARVEVNMMAYRHTEKILSR